MRQFTDSTQIDLWFDSSRRDAQEVLPHLIRLLITATTDNTALKALRIPVGDDINRPGFDGVVEAGPGNRYVPEGFSVWEMGTGDPEAKAENDYDSRTRKSNEVDPAKTTFVFVTPHSWARKDVWCRNKQEERKWKDVRVLDNVDLAAWLEVAPGVARWLARQMGVPIEGLLDVELFTGELNATYGFKIPPELVIGGRADALAALVKWVEKGSSEVSIEAGSVEEAAAFVAAMILSLSAVKRDWLLSRTLFAQQADVLDFVSQVPSENFVVPLSIDARRRAKAVQSGKLRLILPTVRHAGSRESSEETIRLGIIDRVRCEDVLLASGVPPQRAHRIARECKGSLTAALWMVARGPDSPLPWASGSAAVELAPLLLAGRWVADSTEDQVVVARLAACNYSDVERTLATWRTPVGPLARRAVLWDWMAPDYAWDCLASVIDLGLLSRFEIVAMEVLGLPDPRIDLAPDQRWAATVYDKVHPQSYELRSGLIGSLAQLSLRGTTVRGGDHTVSRIINQLLDGKALSRRTTWQSLAPWLPDLAEAAPQDFLLAADALVKDSEAIKELFTEGGFLSSSSHVYLLWALERMAWSESLFARVIGILADLASVDPGGRLTNRPLDSLTRIFLPWHPQGSASERQRLDAIDSLYSRQPEIAWNLAASLLPEHMSFTSPIAEPQWRDWKPPAQHNVTSAEIHNFVREICDRMLSWAGVSGRCWSTLIESYPRLVKVTPELARSVLSSMEQLDPGSFANADRVELTDSLRKVIARQQEFPDADWATSLDELHRLEQLQSSFLPEDPVERHKWLFVSWPRLHQERNLSYEEFSKLVERLRADAVGAIFKAEKLEGILRLGRLAENPATVGLSLSSLSLGQPLEARLLNLTLGITATRDGAPALLQLGFGYVGGKFQAGGTAWLDHVRTLPGIAWDVDKLANLACGLPAEGPTWDRLEAWSEEASRLYWSRVPIAVVRNPERDLEPAVRNLLRAGRPYRAIEVAGTSFPGGKAHSKAAPLPKEILIEALSAAPRQELTAEWYPPDLGSIGHHVEGLFEVLEEQGISTEQIAKLEWAWMALLEHSSRGTRALQELLSTTPSVFVEVLTAAFRGEGDEPRKLSVQEQARAMQAYRLLANWRRVPGTQGKSEPQQTENGGITFDTGRIDETQLLQWVNEARKLAQKSNRLAVCDSRIGNMLAHAPADPDGTWPCEAVRNLIEKLQSEDLDRGIAIGVYNKRGAYFREKGGEQERRLAARFHGFSARVRSRWPRTGAMLHEIAEHYAQDARREDEKAAFEEFE